MDRRISVSDHAKYLHFFYDHFATENGVNKYSLDVKLFSDKYFGDSIEWDKIYGHVACTEKIYILKA